MVIYIIIAILVFIYYMWLFRNEDIDTKILLVLMFLSLIWIVTVPGMLLLYIGTVIYRTVKTLKYKGKHVKEK